MTGLARKVGDLVHDREGRNGESLAPTNNSKGKERRGGWRGGGGGEGDGLGMEEGVEEERSQVLEARTDRDRDKE
jgi:hypothetical protein